MIFLVKDVEFKRWLLRNGFELIGEVGDMLTKPKEWTFHCSKRQYDGLGERQKKGVQRWGFQQGKFKEKKAFSEDFWKGRYVIGGKYHDEIAKKGFTTLKGNKLFLGGN